MTVAVQLRRAQAIALDLIVQNRRARISNATDPAAGTVSWRTADVLEKLGLVHVIEIVAVATDAGKALAAEGLTFPTRRYDHGTHACYTLDGCRCRPCRRAHAAYETRRQADRAEGRTRLVDADPVREHVRSLMATKRGGHDGVGLKQIVKVSGVSQGTLWKLMYGAPDRTGPSKTVRRSTAEKLLAVTRKDMADHASIPAGPTRRKLAAMVEGGWAKAELARILTGNVDAYSLQVAKGRRVSVGNARKVDELHRRWKAGEIVPRGRWSPHQYGPKPITPATPAPAETVWHSCVECGRPSLAGGRWCADCFRARATAPASATGCGTDAGYTAYLRRGDQPCGECRFAHAQANQRRKEQAA